MSAMMRLFLVCILGTFFLPACAPKETWDVVTMGDSFLARSSIPEQYVAFLAEDAGVEVILHEEAVNGQEPEKLLANLRSDEELRQLIREAEVIVFDFSPGWGDHAGLKFILGTCGGEDNQDCEREALEQAKADWTQMADIFAELTAGRPVIYHTFIFGDWPFDGYYKDDITPEERAVLLGYFHEFQTFQEADALARGIFVHHVFPSQTDNPPPVEYLQADKFHLSDEGSLVISSSMREAGYSPLKP